MSASSDTASRSAGVANRRRIIHVDPDKVSLGDIAIGVIIGRASEYFDFFVFGIAAVLVFPQVFFPFASPMTGTLYSFLIFSFAFIARPFGSYLFRVLDSWYGRNIKLTIALFALGTTTAGIAFLPGFPTIGKSAIILLAVLRIGQGLAVGGTWDGLPSLLAVSAPKGRRGWYAMIPQLGGPIGFIIAAALFAYLTAQLSHADFIEWGWRYPFFVAFALNVVALFARLRLVMSPEFVRLLETRELDPAPLGEMLKTQWGSLALGAFAPLASYALFHLVTIFALSWALLFTHQSISGFLLVQVVGGVIALPCMALSGVIADRVGRRNALGTFAVMIAIYSGWGAVLLAGSTQGGYLFVLIGFALLGLAHGQSAGAVNSALPTQYRYSGAIITSDMSWFFGAAFAPLVALLLAAYLGVGYVGLYLLSGAFCTFFALRVNRSRERLAN